jgi:hypothetical protein
MGKKKRKREKKLRTALPGKETSIHRLSHFLEGHIWWVVLGLIILGGFCIHLVFNPNLSTNGDNAHYIVLGMSLAQGSGFKEISNPEMPPAIAPVGYPLLLAPFLALFPDRHLLLKFFSTLLFLLSLPLLLMVIREGAKSILLALGVVVLAAINPHLLDFGQMVMSEIPFLFFSLLGLFFLQRSLNSAGQGMSRRKQFLFGLSILFLVFSYHIRSIGAALLLALMVSLILKRRYRLVLVAGLLILCLVLPWILRSRAVAEGGGYLDQIMMRDPYKPALGKISTGDMLTRVGSNLKTYTIFVIPQALFPPITSRAGRQGIYLALGLAATLVAVLGFVLQARRSIGFIELYTICFFGICIIWPQMWSGVRFLIPIVPFLIYYFLVGLRGLAGAMGSRLNPFLGKLLILFVLVIMVASCLTGLARAGQARASGQVRRYPPEWQNYFLVAEWCREHTPEGSIFLARKPSLFYLRARRPVMNYPYTADTEEMMSFMAQNQVDYVILDGFSWTGTTARYLVPALQKHRDKFQAVHVVENPRTWVLKTVGLSLRKEGE